MLTTHLSLSGRRSLFSGRLLAACALLLCSVAFAGAQDAAFTKLFDFGIDPTSGRLPYGGFVEGQDGNLYGTTENGGGNGSAGTVFQLTPAGVHTITYRFGGGDGSTPKASLILGTDGNFYGTTENGGFYGGGTVFQITPGGTLTTLHSFGSSNDGYSPEGALVIGPDGAFYGTTAYGGYHDNGTVFRLAANGAYTILYDFGSSRDDAAVPTSGLSSGADGNLYGTTLYGGFYDYGTAYQITIAGTLTILHDFGNSQADGVNPDASLLQDGNFFYGTTSAGGPTNTGTVFRVDASGNYAVLYTFPGFLDGVQPESALIAATDGRLYGTTEYGGRTGGGSAYSLALDGSGFATIHSFNGGDTDGANPVAPLFQATNGILYGTTAYGGTSRRGTLFQLDLELPGYGQPLGPGVTYSPPVITAAPKGRGTATFGVRNGRFLVSRASDDLSAPVTVRYTLSGTAVNGVDYRLLSGTTVIPAGALFVKVPVAPLHAVTTPLTVTLTLSASTDYYLGGSTSGTVQITP